MAQPPLGPRFTDLVASLPASVPFVGPETQERARGAVFAARLGANENGFGPSPLAVAAMAQAASETWMYGDPEMHDLRHALAAHHRVSFENIMIGEGIDGLLGYLARMLIAPGDRVVTSLGAYPTFNFHVNGFGGAIDALPYTNDHEDLGALLARAGEVDAKLVYFANPDNPMGTVMDGNAITAALDAIPPGCLLILDEAYLELAPKSAIPVIDPNNPRVIRMRTFSKAYALAGLRVGYCIGAPGLINAFNKIRNHFGVGRLAQAGAIAALADHAHLETTIARAASARDAIAAIGRENGLTPIPSATNFVTMDCGRDGAYARRVLNALIAQGIFARMPFVAPQDRCIRISCGPDAEIAAFKAALPKAIADALTATA